VRLTVDGRRYEQPLTLKMDPRVKTSPEGLGQQFALSMQCYEGVQQARTITAQIQKLRADLRSRGEQAKEAALKDAAAALERKLAALPGTAVFGRGGRGGRGGGSREPTFARVQGEMGQLLSLLQRADATPTSQAVAACGEAQKAFSGLLDRWRELSGKELQALNEKLRGAKLPPITLGGEEEGR
jgi:predicted phage gp36 major capsid-like protein